MVKDALFGFEEKALSLCEMRSAMLARNLANANTPNYKAQDMHFHQELKKAQITQGLSVTHDGHLTSSKTLDDPTSYYRIPMQTSLDGNTVDEEIERKNFMENSIRYQASLAFAQSKSINLIKAIRGE